MSLNLYLSFKFKVNRLCCWLRKTLFGEVIVAKSATTQNQTKPNDFYFAPVSKARAVVGEPGPAVRAASAAGARAEPRRCPGGRSSPGRAPPCPGGGG